MAQCAEMCPLAVNRAESNPGMLEYARDDSQTDTLIAFTGTNQNTGFPFPVTIPMDPMGFMPSPK